MNRKPRSLSTEDRHAIDLLLDHGAIRNNGMKKPTAGVAEPRLSAVARVLSMLDQIPAEDPPADLVSRTMARIDAHRHLTEKQPQAGLGNGAMMH